MIWLKRSLPVEFMRDNLSWCGHFELQGKQLLSFWLYSLTLSHVKRLHASYNGEIVKISYMPASCNHWSQQQMPEQSQNGVLSILYGTWWVLSKVKQSKFMKGWHYCVWSLSQQPGIHPIILAALCTAFAFLVSIGIVGVYFQVIRAIKKTWPV